MASIYGSLQPAEDDDRNETLRPWVQQKVGLSLDGGGIWGYWTLLVLQELMKQIQREEQEINQEVTSSFHPHGEPLNVSRLHKPYTPFLPCHYFDYVAGTSTGALIAILLSRFRMTVEDCLEEYETMARCIFGHPRLIHNIRFGIGGNKYHTKHLENAVKEVIERRAERRSENHTDVLFRTEIDTCRGVILSRRIRKGPDEPIFLFRSYTPFSERTLHQNHGQDIDMSLRLKNPHQGSKISLVKVALAATAAPLYFGHYECTLSAAQVQASKRIPTRMPTNRSNNDGRDQEEETFDYKFEDAGFGLVNNPCRELEKEIGHHHGSTSKILVSIGTARSRTQDEEKRPGRFALLRTVRRAFIVAGDPGPVHEGMEEWANDNENHIYFRFDGTTGIEMEMDEWLPRRTGQRTLANLSENFRSWLNDQPGVRPKLTRCAKTLVNLRRARLAHSPRWERFALVRYFECRIAKCPKDRDNNWFDRDEFRNHLERDHQPDDFEHFEGATFEERRDASVKACEREWEYRT
ncbi:FabD/lysophospholipase-like protein [Xylariaceae sp. FL0255]|nr:FabD/lysophospholipase-like protein [Xylariaceae sp. FL0255]